MALYGKTTLAAKKPKKRKKKEKLQELKRCLYLRQKRVDFEAKKVEEFN